MRPYDHSKHHFLRGIGNKMEHWMAMPNWHIHWHPEGIPVWVIWDEGMFHWRGPINKITAHRMVYGLDYTIYLGRIKLHTQERQHGEDCDLVIVHP